MKKIVFMSLLVFVMSCSLNYKRGKEALVNKDFELAYQYLKKSKKPESRKLAKEVRKAIKIEALLKKSSNMNSEEAESYLKQSIDIFNNLNISKNYFEDKIEQAKNRITESVFFKIRKASEKSNYEKIISIYTKEKKYFPYSSHYKSEIENIYKIAQDKLSQWNNYRNKGNDYRKKSRRVSINKKISYLTKAIQAWKRATDLIPEKSSSISTYIYEAEKEIENVVRNNFKDLEREIKEFYANEDYIKSKNKAQAAIQIAAKHPNLTIDLGVVERLYNLSKESLIEKRKNKENKEENLRVRGHQLSPFVIDCSGSEQREKISSLFEGKLNRSRTKKLWGKLSIPKNKYRKLYSKVDDGYNVKIKKRPNDSNDMVTKIYTKDNKQYFICDYINSGYYYPRLQNVRGNNNYKLENTLYKKLDVPQ